MDQFLYHGGDRRGDVQRAAVRGAVAASRSDQPRRIAQLRTVTRLTFNLFLTVFFIALLLLLPPPVTPGGGMDRGRGRRTGAYAAAV